MQRELVICGAGIAGIAAAWHLTVRRRVRGVVLIEQDAPLALTSDKSTECYRNWWPGPDNAMVALTGRSIDLMEALAHETRNAIGLDRRGYLFVSADPARALEFEATAREAEALGAGALRIHREGSDRLQRPSARGFDGQPDGADLLQGRALIRRYFPYLTGQAQVALLTRRCGALSAQQLGMVMLEQARDAGLELVRGRVCAVSTANGAVEAVEIQSSGTERLIRAPVLVNAAGPHLNAVAALLGFELPVVCERHAKLTFDDRESVIGRDAPLLVWSDPTELAWNDEEREALAAGDETRALLEPFPAGVHGRPVGRGQSVMLYWTYDCPHEAPQFPVVWDPRYPEILVRGMSVMLPGLRSYFQRIPGAYVDGGYYTKAPENRPLIGPTSVPGAYLMGAFSGFGIMSAMGAGELLAAHVTGDGLPAYADAFSPLRFDDPSYQQRVQAWTASGQI